VTDSPKSPYRPLHQFCGVREKNWIAFGDIDQDAIIEMVARAFRKMPRRITPRAWTKSPEYYRARADIEWSRRQRVL